MRIQPGWRVALMVLLLYNAIVFGTWAAFGADYRYLSSAENALTQLLLPMGLGTLLVTLAVTWLGWWRPATTETLARPAARWPLWALSAAMLALSAANLAAVPWAALAPAHVLMLITACALVGFNEELVTRGVVLTCLRGAGVGEAGVWFWSCLLFGAMHVPNALFGMPLAAGVLQGTLAFVMGGALYALRRTSGALWLPMALHGLWDFSSLCLKASGGASAYAVYCQFATYLLAIAAVPALLRRRTSA
ncbi:hypothetical protein SAMN05192549_10495 [Duganella sacchari]|uniref:CAAX prenyl protease 2/Lysostaphin resistance protein A-like domain-containing protein n=1 Tax=Duganella sacchari TaxID=551987 RepID=A0A1M7NQG2_9BURK|nr:CPBP family intramembrane glutamic endopeptidase [Duganella sacchari]SHN05837.1 hypothetical protein SAMN05192549_10495 [Duganella sacchari]